MKIIQLEAENVKGLKAVRITADGKSVILGGNNAAGKSSILDAIEAALGGKRKAPVGTVRAGTSKARIVLETEELIVSRIITEKTNQVRVIPKDNPKSTLTSPQKVLDALFGALTFDPLEFERAEPRAQAEILRKMVGLDFTALNAARKAKYEERTEFNRVVNRLEVQRDSLPGPHKGVPEDVRSPVELQEEISTAQAHNRRNHEERQDVNRLAHEVEGKIVAVKEARSLLERREAEVMDAKTKAESARIEATKLVDIDVEPLLEEMGEVDGHRQRKAENATIADVEGQLHDAKASADQLSTQIKLFDDRKAKAIAKAKYPIEGLEAHDDGVRLGGVPFGRASQAERLRACVAIGMALNPELRVLLIRDGCRLDENGVKLLAQMAEEADAQVWLERVGKGNECTVIIEDGEVEESDADPS